MLMANDKIDNAILSLKQQQQQQQSKKQQSSRPWQYL